MGSSKEIFKLQKTHERYILIAWILLIFLLLKTCAKGTYKILIEDLPNSIRGRWVKK